MSRLDRVSDLAGLLALIDETYAPSRGIPQRVREGLSEPLLRILDYLHGRVVDVLRALADLRDVESVQGRDPLMFMALEFGLPVPDFATESQLRALARDAWFIAARRNTVLGWERYLRDLSDPALKLSVRLHRIRGRAWQWGKEKGTFPSTDMLQTAGLDTDDTAYFFSDALFRRTLRVVVRGNVTETFKRWAVDTAALFIPMLPSGDPLFDLEMVFAPRE